MECLERIYAWSNLCACLCVILTFYFAPAPIDYLDTEELKRDGFTGTLGKARKSWQISTDEIGDRWNDQIAGSLELEFHFEQLPNSFRCFGVIGS